jgi:hypothetical protein
VSLFNFLYDLNLYALQTHSRAAFLCSQTIGVSGNIVLVASSLDLLRLLVMSLH